MDIELFANEADSHPPDDEYLECVWFRDRAADCVFALSRFAPPSPEDRGKIEIIVHDQVHAETDSLSVVLYRERLEARFDAATAEKLNGVASVVVHFCVNGAAYARMRHTLKSIFRDISGFSEVAC